ncbi:NAD(P)/FAD-dependent oxidoreductase [Parachryseolinea silvisoli]|uniref:NAD(P)/FAD-dependent oxidoreductase n=1 Tax=Parachryseolinea silvisoli TaxID=2873601 RepID=UPI002265828B|nr:FAD-dependent oxidoreductase [Parachryseolinea silvisoli]
MQAVDYIVVGQGLAGSAVAVQLLQRKKRIVVIDQPTGNSSSRIAAGLFNPITGKKMTKTWLADTLFPYLHEFYQAVEARTARKFFFPMPLYRPFLSIEEQNDWMARSAEPGYAPYIDTIHQRPAIPGIHDPWGGLLLRQCGYLDTTGYIDAVRSWITAEGTLLQTSFDPANLHIAPNGVQYGTYAAAQIIFCQGVVPAKGFEWLPVKPLKGETIRIKTDFQHNAIINRGVYLVPGTEPGERRVGATYDFHDSTPTITPAARETLGQKLKELVDFPYEITSQEWGFRPTVPDRRPLVGVHPEHPSVAVFTGLGTKGVSLSPYFSEVLIRRLENQVPLNKEIDIERYKSLY